MEPQFQSDIDAIARIPAVPLILDVVCAATGMGFAAVARVTEDRWIACSVRDTIAFGLVPGGELKVETTICSEIRGSRKPVAINCVAESTEFRDHPTPAMYGFQSYISTPIILPGGEFFGTLCAIDRKPAQLERPETVNMFKLFADLIAFHLDTHRRLASSEASLNTERHGSELREQFIAILGHDLRNPLAAIDAGTRLLRRTPLNDSAVSIVDQMHNSVARMNGIIGNVLDFARGRLGGGFALNKSELVALQPTLEQVISELTSVHPERVVEKEFVLETPVRCDPERIGQMFSNLLANALTHGAHDTAVRVRAVSDASAFELSVANNGPVIPAATIANLFSPFFRAGSQQNQQGLGLGLYISSEIAKAHGGTLTAISSEDETRFTFSMPADAVLFGSANAA